MKITRVGGRISRDWLPPGGQPVHGWLAPRGSTCPGGKINWDTGICQFPFYGSPDNEGLKDFYVVAKTCCVNNL